MAFKAGQSGTEAPVQTVACCSFPHLLAATAKAPRSC